MKLRNWVTLAGITAGALGVGMGAKRFLPQRFALDTWDDEPLKLSEKNAQESRKALELPEVDVAFLRCGTGTMPEWVAAFLRCDTGTVPEWVAVRGGLFAPVDLAYS